MTKITVSFKREPYYAGLLIALDDLLQNSRMNAEPEDATLQSVENYSSILCELSMMTMYINDMTDADINTLCVSCKRITDDAQEVLSERSVRKADAK